jgi:ribosomal protein S4
LDTVVAVVQREKTRKVIEGNLESTRGEPVPAWLACDPKQMEIRVLRLPGSEDLSFPIQSNLIVELLAK